MSRPRKRPERPSSGATVSRFQLPAALAVGLLVLGLAACSSGSTGLPQQDSISGTITAPAGHDVQGAVVRLCPDEGDTCLEEVVQGTGAAATFAFTDVTGGTYRLVASKAVSQESFLAGCHGTAEGVVCSPVPISPPQQGADIELVLVELPTPPEPTTVD